MNLKNCRLFPHRHEYTIPVYKAFVADNLKVTICKCRYCDKYKMSVTVMTTITKNKKNIFTQELMFEYEFKSFKQLTKISE